MQKLLGLFLLAWAVAFFGSFIAFYLTPARDFGLTSGWNKIAVLMSWQLAATFLALCCLVFRWTTTNTRRRRLAAVPAVCTGLFALTLGALMIWFNLQSSGPEIPVPTSSEKPPAPATDG